VREGGREGGRESEREREIFYQHRNISLDLLHFTNTKLSVHPLSSAPRSPPTGPPRLPPLPHDDILIPLFLDTTPALDFPSDHAVVAATLAEVVNESQRCLFH